MPQIDLSRAVWRKSTYSSQSGNCVEVARLQDLIATWRKSTYSGQNGNCVEVARNVQDVVAAWHKSTYSSQNGACVEVARNLPRLVAVRDSKHPDAPALLVTAQAWQTFIDDVRAR